MEVERKMSKVLHIKIVGHDYIYAEQVTEKTKPNQPDFKGDGVVVWVRDKKPQVQDVL